MNTTNASKQLELEPTQECGVANWLHLSYTERDGDTE